MTPSNDHQHHVPDKDEPNLVWREKPSPSNAELRKQVYAISPDISVGDAEAILALFQAQKQQLLDELVGEKQLFHNPAIKEGVEGAFVDVVPVSVIESKRNQA